jgi:hypothetical protein
MRSMSSSSSPNAKTVQSHVRLWNRYVVEFCDPEGYDPWVFSVTKMELFAGWVFESGTRATMDAFFSAINYVLTVHDCAELYRGGRVAAVKADFKKTMRRDRNAKGLLTYRALIPDHGMLQFFEHIRAAETEGNDVLCLRAVLILVKIMTWVRAASMGTVEPEDITFIQNYLTVTIRSSKCGKEDFEPTQFSIPPPPKGNQVATFVMSFIRRSVNRLSEVSAEAAGLTKANAADRMSEWMRAFMPSDVLNLPAGSFISSHSSRETGASHCRCSLDPPLSWDGEMAWGGWANQLRCLGYVKVDTRPSAFWRDFFFWLSPLHQVNFIMPRQGYFEEGG